MRRSLYLLLLLLLMPALGSAREAWRGWCEQGAKHVVTSGLTSTSTVQLSSGGCQVTVYVHGGALATLYADNNGTPKANPFTADTNGMWIWYADNNRYDVTTSSATLGTVTYSDILLCDPAIVGSACGSGGGGVSSINIYKNGTLVGTEPGVDFIEGTNVTIDPATDDPPTKVHLTLNSAEQVALAGTLVGIEPRINFIQGANVTLTVADNTGVSPPRIDVTVASSAGTGTVTSFSAGTLSPLFTTSVATATTTPALSFILTNAAAHTFFGNNTASTGAPSYFNLNLYKTCQIIIGADNGAVLADADIGPQADQCFVSNAGTVIEVGVVADAGTPTSLPSRDRLGTVANLLSGALAAAAGTANYKCSNVGGTTSLNGTTTCSATLQNTALLAGDYINVLSGTAGGTAKKLSIHVTWQIN